jgi:hypothetical protein
MRTELKATAHRTHLEMTLPSFEDKYFNSFIASLRNSKLLVLINKRHTAHTKQQF